MRWMVVCAVLAGGCAQGPGAMDFVTGGIGVSQDQSQGQVVGRLYRISVPRSKFADSAAVEDYALVKAAQATKRAGGTHFLVVRGAEETGGMAPPAALLANYPKNPPPAAPATRPPAAPAAAMAATLVRPSMPVAFQYWLELISPLLSC